MTDKLIEHTFESLPPLTDAQKADLDRLAAMPDEDIDTSDIPELTDAQLARMRRPEHYRPVKTQITISVDADVLAWLKAGDQGYQSRVNAILLPTPSVPYLTKERRPWVSHGIDTTSHLVLPGNSKRGL